jgi:hypothetical protein
VVVLLLPLPLPQRCEVTLCGGVDAAAAGIAAANGLLLLLLLWLALPK